MGGYLLLIQLYTDLACDALQLPPVGLVKGFDLCHVVGWLNQLTLRVLLGSEDGHHELNPVVDPVRFKEERQQLERVRHVENLHDADHNLHLKRVGAVSNCLTHDALQYGVEGFCNLDKDLPFLVDLELERAHKLFQQTESCVLGFGLLALKAALDLGHAVGPVPGFEVGLGDVVEDVLQLGAKHNKLNSKDANLPDLLVLLAVHVHAREDVRLNEFFVLLADLRDELVSVGACVLTLVFFVAIGCVELAGHLPAAVDDGL
jgi:hypothetical protein